MNNPSLRLQSLNMTYAKALMSIVVVILFLTLCQMFANISSPKTYMAPLPRTWSTKDMAYHRRVTSYLSSTNTSTMLSTSSQTSGSSFAAPEGEAPRRRLPQCVIIGFPKCGTRALLTYLSLHPYVRTYGPEMHFYDDDERFARGYEWYREQMPLSYSNQITVEKTPAYVSTPLARTEMKKKVPNVKLIVLVRDPVERILSAYAQIVDQKRPNAPLASFYKDMESDRINESKRSVSQSMYHVHLSEWFRTFRRQQILVLNGDELTYNPVATMLKVEVFLGIPSLFLKSDIFFKNTTSGFYCYRDVASYSDIKCLGKSKGRTHKKLPAKEEKKLYNFFRPYNDDLFELIHHNFTWPMNYQDNRSQ